MDLKAGMLEAWSQGVDMDLKAQKRRQNCFKPHCTSSNQIHLSYSTYRLSVICSSVRASPPHLTLSNHMPPWPQISPPRPQISAPQPHISPLRLQSSLFRPSQVSSGISSIRAQISRLIQASNQTSRNLKSALKRQI